MHRPNKHSGRPIRRRVARRQQPLAPDRRMARLRNRSQEQRQQERLAAIHTGEWLGDENCRHQAGEWLDQAAGDVYSS